MTYQINLGVWNSVFAVPCALADRHLKLAGKEQLQVILWTLRHAGEPFDEETLSKALGISRDSTLDALEYWVNEGLLTLTGGTLAPTAQIAEAVTFPVPSEEASQPEAGSLPPKRRLQKPDGAHLAARMKESPNIRYLMQEAELTLGKTLSPALSAALLGICDDYGLPPEVVTMILHYAKEIGKTGTSYIDSVARDWAQSGIFTLEAAEEKLQALSLNRQAWSKVESAAGIPRRSPSKKEEETAYRWVYEWKFTPVMLSAAYERCVNSAGKFSMAYMNKILERWHMAGYTLPEQVEAEEERKKKDGKPEKSYDIDDIERMSFFDPPEEW